MSVALKHIHTRRVGKQRRDTTKSGVGGIFTSSNKVDPFWYVHSRVTADGEHSARQNGVRQRAGEDFSVAVDEDA